MPITRIAVYNYKSLKSVSIDPKPLTVIVGANGSGKTNLADCLDFIGDVYRHGLEVAISKKGGYDNIAFRRQQRSKLPIRILVSVELSPSELLSLLSLRSAQHEEDLKRLSSWRIVHAFEVVANSTAIRAQFKVTNENLDVQELNGDSWRTLLSVIRDSKGFHVEAPGLEAEDRASSRRLNIAQYIRDFSDVARLLGQPRTFAPTELAVSALGRFTMGLIPFIRTAGAIRVYQISTTRSREAGVPSSNPELDRFGGNLPAVIEEMQKNKPAAWSAVMEVMRGILPDLKTIEVDYASSRGLGIFFREEGFRRTWSVDEVSDGTLQTLALLVALFDPNSSLLVLEELENSVHPWIIRRVLDACRKASESKQIMLTTHSPIVLNAMTPENIWVIWREKGESHLAPMTSLDPELLDMWADGQVSTFDYIDSGALPLAIPPSPSEDLLLSEVGSTD